MMKKIDWTEDWIEEEETNDSYVGRSFKWSNDKIYSVISVDDNNYYLRTDGFLSGCVRDFWFKNNNDVEWID